jgi:cell division protease FtsH
MSTERWFPVNHKLPNGPTLRKLVISDDEWQLYSVGQASRVLIVKPELGQRWISENLLAEASLKEIKFGENVYLAIESGNDQQLAPVTEFISPETKEDATAFSISMFQTREVLEDTSFHDAIYVERLSRLLPNWSVSEKVSDEHVLGRWLTGGVAVSASSFRRMTNLLGWLDPRDVKEVIQSAGIQIGGDKEIIRSKRRKKQGSPPIAREATATKNSQNTEDDMTKKELSQEFRLSGRPFLEVFFNEHVVDIILNEDRYKAMGVDFPSAVVLHGPPGCGKTFAVERLIEFLDWPAYHVDSNSIGSPYIHETSRKVAEIFEIAMENSPAVIVIDEMESFLTDRQHGQSTGLHHVEEVAEFLRRIPEAMTKKVLVVGMTNRLEMIDPAILRRGRFDHVIEVGMPGKKETTDLVTSLLGKMPIDGELSIEKAISTLTNRPLSDASFAIREAGRLAAKSGKDKIDQDSLNDALARLPDDQSEEKDTPIGFIWN